MNQTHIKSDQEVSKMAQKSSSPQTPVGPPSLPMRDSTSNFERFLDASNSHVTRLIREGLACLQSTDGPIDVDRSDNSPQSPFPSRSASDGGVLLSLETSETSSSSGGVQLSDSMLNLRQSWCSSSMSDADDSSVDIPHDTHTFAGLYAPTSTLTSSVQASCSGSLASSEWSSDSGSWAPGERTWSFERVVRLLQQLLGGYWDRSPLGALSHAPSLTSAETLSSSAMSVSDSSSAVVVEYLPHLPLDSGDELTLDFDDEPSIADSDDSVS
jgi:hypothetical protein